jgi:hypothetical protein
MISPLAMTRVLRNDTGKVEFGDYLDHELG